MTAFVAIVADLLVAVLLVATIVTARRLSVRMAAMKADEGAMRATIGELMVATDAAERAIGGLRAAVGDSERLLGDRLGAAARQATRLAEQVAAGDAVLDRVAQVAELGRRGPAEPDLPARREPAPAEPSRLRSTVQAARELSLRAAGRVSERAA